MPIRGVKVPRRLTDHFDFEAAFGAVQQAQAEGIVIQPLLETHHEIIELAAKHRLPMVSAYRRTAAAGALLSYATDQLEQARRAATLVSKILRGAKAADLPVEQSTKFELVVNLKTADALGLTIPPTLLARADEVIE